MMFEEWMVPTKPKIFIYMPVAVKDSESVKISRICGCDMQLSDQIFDLLREHRRLPLFNLLAAYGIGAFILFEI